MSEIRIIGWNPNRKLGEKVLGGIREAHFPSGIIFHDLLVIKSNRSKVGYYAAPKGRARLNRDGSTARNGSGKIAYEKVVSFATAEAEQRFSGAIMEALFEQNPELLPTSA